MRNQAPALMPIFRSRHQADLLAWLYLRPEEEYTLADLASRLRISAGTLHAEVVRLVGAGLILDRNVGRSRLVRANTAARTAKPLTELLTLTFGPHIVIEDEFSGLEDVGRVLLYGSWARRYNGEVGLEPADVDVMVIGSPDRDAVYAAAEESEQRLGMPVNPTVRSPQAWAQAADALVVTAKNGPHLVVIAHGDEAA